MESDNVTLGQRKTKLTNNRSSTNNHMDKNIAVNKLELISGFTDSKKASHRFIRRNLAPYWFLLPAFILYVAFFIYPLIYSFYLSFHKWNLISPIIKFVGFSNYTYLFHAEIFRKSLVNTLLYVLYTVPASMIIGLILALLIEKLKRGKQFYRSLFFLPVICTTAIISIVWELMYNPNIGTINKLLGMIGIHGGNWLNDPKLALAALAVIGIWKQFGYNMVLFISGMKAINQEMYEAISIDGAGRLKQTWHITIPLLSPTTFFVLIMSVISSFQVFTTIQVITQGGPNNATNVVVYEIYLEAFKYFDIGTATASSLLFLIIVSTFTILQLKLGQKHVYYQ